MHTSGLSDLRTPTPWDLAGILPWSSRPEQSEACVLCDIREAALWAQPPHLHRTQVQVSVVLAPRGADIIPAGYSFRGTNRKRIIPSPLVNFIMKKPSMKNGVSEKIIRSSFFSFSETNGGAWPTDLSAARRRVHRSLLSASCFLPTAS